jgi:hypothetical protein
MASHELITAQLDQLARRLPAPAVDELADGLITTYEQQLARGLAPADAAEAAIDEFGRPDDIVAAFVHHSPGRRTARVLLASGPLLAAVWAPSLVLNHAWTWPVAPAAVAAFGLALAAVVGALVTAATNQHHPRRDALAPVGAGGLMLLDATAVAVIILVAPAIATIMVIAVAASVIRIGLTARAVLGRLAIR